jgi:predicted nucleic-acid-binding protein
LGEESQVIALDTNLLVRLVTNDHPELAKLVARLLDRHECFISRVVLLEFVQVLEGPYGLARAQVFAALEVVFSLDSVRVEGQLGAQQAALWYRDGMDFADAMVIAAAQGQRALATFDRDLIGHSQRLGTRPEAVDAALLAR